MNFLQQQFSVSYSYRVYFLSGVFDAGNSLFFETLFNPREKNQKQKILFVIDDGVSNAFPHLTKQIQDYLTEHGLGAANHSYLVIPGGEVCKNDTRYFDQITKAIHEKGIDRHSYVVGIGGGAILDLAGYAAAVGHRGIRMVRIPTTVLSQNDSGIGVKNGINFFGKKNFLGTFAPPRAVFNDSRFLTTLSQRDWRSGISEAVKVALIKNEKFFTWLEKEADKLVKKDAAAMDHLIRECARLHLEHIGGDDPFETGSSRPLDFGHWSAHKLEQLTNFNLLHGEAVALGIALDSVYSYLKGWLSYDDCDRIIHLLQKIGFDTFHPLLKIEGLKSPLLAGLEEFREHLGGRLTIMMLEGIGRRREVNELDLQLVEEASGTLKGWLEKSPAAT